MTRNLRRLAALLALFGLLSAQAALAAYICPGGNAHPPPAASVHAQCGAQDGFDPAIEGALCELHCQVNASVPSAPAADLASPALPPLVVTGASAHGLRRDAAAPTVRPDALAAAPPATIRYCRLLI